MEVIKGYELVDLDAKSVIALETKLASAFKTLSNAACENYAFADVKRLRTEYKTGQITLRYHPSAKKVLEELISMEGYIIGVFIRLAVDPARKFNRWSDSRPGVMIDDYIQQCADTIYDCMYTYTGHKKFSTYVRICMRNRLIDFTRHQDREAAFSLNIRKLASKVKRMMLDGGFRFNEAVARLEVEEEITDMLRNSLGIPDEHDTGPETTMPDFSELRGTIERAPLEPIHRKVIESYLQGYKDWAARLAETEINPRTGVLYTRQRLCQLFSEACCIVRETHGIPVPKKAA
jgi:DNA-directed RNA polymerase specialized sigma24 family protein